MQIPAGLLLDRFGPRKVTTIAIIFCGLGSLLFAKSGSVLNAGIGRFLTGAGAAFAAVNCLKLIANWFPVKRFAFMAGLMMTLGMLGAVGGQAPLAAFIKTMDWRGAMQIIAFAGIILAVIFWLIVRDRAPSHKVDARLTSPRVKVGQSLKKILKNPQAWWISLYSGLAFAPVMVFGGLWGVSFISEAFQLRENTSAQAVSLIFIGFAIGAPFFGWFSDWIGKRKAVMGWGTLLATLCITAVIYFPSLSSLILNPLLFLFGFGISTFLLCFTMIREINTAAHAATAIGFMNAFDALLGAFSDPLTGKILDMNWSGALSEGARVFSVDAYKIAFITIPVFLVLSLFTLFMVKETFGKQTEPTTLP